jgi:hypothetical protein
MRAILPAMTQARRPWALRIAVSRASLGDRGGAAASRAVYASLARFSAAVVQ